MKLRHIFIVIALSLMSLPAAYAKTDITGDAYGQVIGTMLMMDAGVPYGVTIEDINAGENCDNSSQTCLLEGFSWADKIGWTYWDGTTLQTELGGAGNFPDEYIPKITYIGAMGGFAWGEKFGWLQLSACSSIDVQGTCDAKSYCMWTGNNLCEIDPAANPPEPASQTDTDWGVYIDFCPLKSNQGDCESAESDPYCNWDAGDSVCVFDSAGNPDGQPLRGFAWSQHLGWVKFGQEGVEPELNGAFTNWFPDLTPPTFEGVEEGWIPNESAIGTISWIEFADENDGPIDLANSNITVNTDGGADFIGCPNAAPQANGDLVISQGGSGEVNLSIPLIGLIGTPPHGFCKFTLGGVIYNNSGFGHYFGPEGEAAAIADGVDPMNPFPSTYDADNVTLYVRAGDLDLPSSSLSLNSGADVGDGNSIVDLVLSPTDLAGNPIIPVKTALVPGVLPEPVQADWVRDVELLYDFDQNSEYYFDRIDVARNLMLGNPVPVGIESSIYNWNDTLQYPAAGPLSLTHVAGDYLLDVVGFAPTSAVGNVLELTQVDLETIDEVLPAVSPSQGPWNTGLATTIDNGSALPANPLPYSYVFAPALEVTNGQLNSQFIVIGQSVEATYDLINNSSDMLTAYSLDHTLSFTDTGGIGEEVLEVRDINLTGLADTSGRTDPDATETRYEVLRNAGDEGSNQFHSNAQNYHIPGYNFNTNTDNAGIYEVSGDYYVSPEDECLTTPPCPPVDIDRSDSLAMDLNASGGIGSFTFAFTPAQYIGEPVVAQVEFGIAQYLAYSAQASPFAQFALYPAPAHIDGVEVKSIGLGATGVVSGEKVFETVGGRDLETITTTSSADLRREIRRNVAALTRSITPCNAPQLINSLSTIHGGCIAVDDVNNTVIAVYDGPGLITLGSGADLTVPAGYKYSIILLNGANLAIESNLSYGGQNDNSLGLIIMQASDGSGGNVYLDPAPTNMVGLLYAEGSLLSSPDGGANLYYGAGADANDLKNQLYWQGSLATRNTIGGAPNRVLPDNVDCSPWNNDAGGCSQAYDLDFIRRFTILNDMGIDFAPAGYLFSGGGSCAVGAAPNPGCALGALPTTITLTGDSIELANSKSTDTFFVERDNRPVPPGFSSSAGFNSSSEIR